MRSARPKLLAYFGTNTTTAISALYPTISGAHPYLGLWRRSLWFFWRCVLRLPAAEGQCDSQLPKLGCRPWNLLIRLVVSTIRPMLRPSHLAWLIRDFSLGSLVS